MDKKYCLLLEYSQKGENTEIRNENKREGRETIDINKERITAQRS